MEAALEVGAEDIISQEDGSIDVLTRPDAFMDVKDALVAGGFEPEQAEMSMRPATMVVLELEDAEKVMRLVDMLEELDDVQDVYSNADFSDEVMHQLVAR